MARALTILVCAFFMITSAVGQQAASEKLLLPVWNNQPTPGAFGSIWKTELAIVNHGTGPVQIVGYDYGCTLATCAPAPATPPGVTFSPLLSWVPTEVQGFFLYVAKSGAPAVQFELRVRDVTRQQETWGSEVPVVREQEYRSTAFDLVDIPLGPAFRQTLRVYDVDPDVGPAQVSIQVFGTAHRVTPFDSQLQPASSDPLLLTVTRDLKHASSGGGVFSYPGYVEISDFAQLANGFDSVRIEIQPLTPGHRYWALVSVTHNATQSVTIISPH